MKALPLLLVAAFSLSCHKEGAQTPSADPKVNLPTQAIGPEPGRVKVDHILIAFAGAARSMATRSKEEAEQSAKKVLDAAKRGEDWADLKKKYSDDPPPGGPYGIYQEAAAMKPGDYPRKDMAAAFGNVGFKLDVGEIGLAPYDPKASPFGWHIIKRIE